MTPNAAARRSSRLRIAARPFVALFALFAFAGAARSARADEARVEGPHSLVFGERGTPASSLAAARDLVEAELPLLESKVPWRLQKGARLVVRLCADPEDYRRVVKAGGAGAFSDNLAATVDMTGESVVVLQPRAEADVVALSGGLPTLTQELVAHELFHQHALKSDVPVRPWWPDWYAEGMAEWLADETLRATKPAEAQPVLFFEDRAHQVLDALAHDRALGLVRLLHAETLQFRPVGDVYAHAWSLVRFLAADAKRFQDLQAAMAALPEPPQGDRAARRVATAKAAAAALTAVYGPLDALETRWRAAIRSARPGWAIPARSAERIGRDRFLLTAFPDENALLVSTAPPAAASFEMTGVLRMIAIGDRQADLVVAHERRDAQRFVKLALGPGYVTMLAYADGCWQDRYRVNAAVSADAMPVDRPLRFSLRLDGGRLSFSLEGKRLFEAEAPPGFDFALGAWGVGCHNGAAVFEELKTTPIAK